MLETPEFEPEFYKKQIQMMEQRYAVLFEKKNLSWKKYYKQVVNSLHNKPYWIWVYLVGFEKFIQEEMNKNKVKYKELEFDMISRIKRIIGDHFRVDEYVRSLK